MRPVLDEVVQSGDCSENAAKLKSLFPSLLRSITEHGINEPLKGLLVKSVLNLVTENDSLRKRMDASTVKFHLTDEGLAKGIKRTIPLTLEA